MLTPFLQSDKTRKIYFTGRGLICLALIVLISGALGFFTLSRGHLWWDDFAGYLMQSKSILSWTMAEEVARNTFTVDNSSYAPGPAAYPWGFPLLAAPVYAIFGLNPLALKLIGLSFFLVFLVVTAFFARSRLGEVDALLLVGFLAVSPVLIASSDLIQSDLPFLFFSTLGLLMIDRLSLKRVGYGCAIGVFIFMAYFLRTNGVLLLAPLFIVAIIENWPNWRTLSTRLAAPLLTFSALVFLQMILFPGGQGSYFSHFALFSFSKLLENVIFYAVLPALVFDKIPGGAALYPLMLVFIFFSLVKHWRRDAAMHAYGLLTVLLFVIWPERQGLRFIYPVLPFLFISAFDGVIVAAGFLRSWWNLPLVKIWSVLWGLVIIVALAISAASAYQITKNGREINGPFDVYSYQMYEFIREKTPQESILIFMRPRALRLFTDRDAFMTQRCEDLVKGDYIILHMKIEPGNGQIPPEEVTSCNPMVRLEEVYKNKRFNIYKINR